MLLSYCVSEADQGKTDTALNVIHSFIHYSLGKLAETLEPDR